MKERLVIKNFGPIKSVDLELGKMTILIGEQATGKSTIAKVLAICRYFSYIVDEFENGESFFSNGIESWGLIDFIQKDSFISYECSEYAIIGNSTAGKLYILAGKTVIEKYFINLKLKAKSKEFKNLLIDYEVDKNLEDETTTNFYQKQVSKIMNNPFYVPTERGLQSIFSLGKNSIQNISDSLFNQFAKMDRFNRTFQNETEIKPLNLIYKNIKGQGFIKNQRQEEFSSLYNGASGYQSTIPVVLAIKYYSEIRRKSKTFIIEEPELNLFPKAQKKLMEFFVENINNNGHSFLLPTHSPYFLSAINDLLMAYKKGQKNKSEVEKIIKKESWLNPNDLSVYQLKDGFAHDIFDKELNLIGENIIDEVSDEMNEEFEELLDIK
jgi:predicted ATPase